MKNFVDEAQEYFDVGTGTLQSRVSLVTFGATATLKFDFNEHTSNQAVSTAVQALEYDRCLSKETDGSDKLSPNDWCIDRVDTHTRLAFDKVEDDVLVVAAGVRPAAATVTRVVVTITDGHPTIIRAPPMVDGVNTGPVITSYEADAEALALRDAGVITIGVGVRQDTYGNDQLQKMVGGDPGMMIKIYDFETLAQKVEELANLICIEAGGDEITSGGFGEVGNDGGDCDDDGSCASPDMVGDDAIALDGSETDPTDTCIGANDGYKWSLAITATLKCAPKDFSADADQLTINGDGSGGILLPGDVDELAIDTVSLSKVTNDALRLRGEIGFNVKGKSIECLKNLKGRVYFGLADNEALMNVFGTEYVHLTQFSVEMLFHGSYPFIDKIVAKGALSLGLYGRAAKCHLLDTWADCSNVLELSADFTYQRTETYKGNLTALTFELNLGLRPSGGQVGDSSALIDLYNVRCSLGI
jgi:hypothetical protein